MLVEETGKNDGENIKGTKLEFERVGDFKYMGAMKNSKTKNTLNSAIGQNLN